LKNTKILDLARQIHNLTEQTRSLQFDLQHREDEHEILIQKIDEQMKKNKNITMKKDQMLLDLQHDIKSKEQALLKVRDEIINKDEEREDLLEMLNKQISKNTKIVVELQDLRKKYTDISILESEIQSQEDAIMNLEMEISDSENVITQVENSLGSDSVHSSDGNSSVSEQSSVPEFNQMLEHLYVLQSPLGGWSSSYEPRKYNPKSINILAAVRHGAHRPRRYPLENYHSFSVSSSWFKSFYLLK